MRNDKLNAMKVSDLNTEAMTTFDEIVATFETALSFAGKVKFKRSFIDTRLADFFLKLSHDEMKAWILEEVV